MTNLLLINLVLVVTILEALGLLALWYLTGRGIDPRRYLANLCSGLALMLALRAALLDVHWIGVAVILLLAGLFHAFQMAVYLNHGRNESRDPKSSPRTAATPSAQI